MLFGAVTVTMPATGPYVCAWPAGVESENGATGVVVAVAVAVVWLVVFITVWSGESGVRRERMLRGTVSGVMMESEEGVESDVATLA